MQGLICVSPWGAWGSQRRRRQQPGMRQGRALKVNRRQLAPRQAPGGDELRAASFSFQPNMHHKSLLPYFYLRTPG